MLKVFSGHRPDITPAQLAAVLVVGVPAISNVLAAFGVFVVTPAEQHALTEALKWGGVFAGLLVGGDAHLRASRNKADATVQAAAMSAVSTPPPPVGAGEDDIDADLPSDEEEFAAPPPDDTGPESRVEPVAEEPVA